MLYIYQNSGLWRKGAVSREEKLWQQLHNIFASSWLTYHNITAVITFQCDLQNLLNLKVVCVPFSQLAVSVQSIY